ncbi:unnamed protein product [Calypogeia fissa]
MVKAGPGLLYTLLLVALICLFMFSEQPVEDQETRLYRRQFPGGGRQLGIRGAKKHETLPFDPLVAAVEQRREDRAWEQQYWTHQYKVWANQAQHWVGNPNEGQHQPPQQQHHQEQQYSEVQPAVEAEAQPNPWEHFNFSDYDTEEYAGEDYLNSEQFNITHRLEVLFPQIDTEPHDGFVTLPELERWHTLSALRVTSHRTEREMETHDMNRDGFISFTEYLPHYTSDDVVGHQMEVGGAGWWKEQFDNADADGDGLLNRSEFHEFLHPEDSKMEKIHRWIIRQELHVRSNAHGYNLTWDDFHHNVFDVIRDYGTEESAPDLAHLNPYRDMEARKQILSRAKFNELDTNKDGFITDDEAEPFVNRLRPGELYYAKVQAEELIEQADDDKDGRLSLQEMLTHPYVFYNTAYDHGHYAYSHDEFR